MQQALSCELNSLLSLRVLRTLKEHGHGMYCRRKILAYEWIFFFTAGTRAVEGALKTVSGSLAVSISKMSSLTYASLACKCSKACLISNGCRYWNLALNTTHDLCFCGSGKNTVRWHLTSPVQFYSKASHKTVSVLGQKSLPNSHLHGMPRTFPAVVWCFQPALLLPRST